METYMNEKSKARQVEDIGAEETDFTKAAAVCDIESTEEGIKCIICE